MFVGIVARARSRRGLLCILLAAVLWGTVGIGIKAVISSSGAGALSVGFLRMALSVPFLLVGSRCALGYWNVPGPGRGLGALGVIGVMMAVYQVAYVLAIARVGVAVAVLVTICTAPLIVALLSAVLLREAPTRRLLAALALALLGTALLIGRPDRLAVSHLRAAEGIALALAAAAAYAVVVLAGRRLPADQHPLSAAGCGFAIGSAALLPFLPADGATLAYSLENWAILIYLGAVPTALAYGLFLAGLRSTSATVAATATLLEPLTSTLLAVLLFGERLGSWGALGGVLLLGAILALYRSERAEAPVP